MANFLIAFCGIFLLIGLIFEPKKINPISVFFGEWMIIIYLSKLNLFSMQKTSENTYFYILIGCIMYAIGFYFFRCLNWKNVRLKKPFSHQNQDTIYIINKKFVYVFTIITFVFFLGDFFTSLVYLLQGQTLNFLRQRAQEGALFNNPIKNAIRILIAAPFSLALTPMIASNFFSKKREKYLLVFTVIILLSRLLSDGGRSPFVYLVMCFLICYTYTTKDSKISRKKIKKNKFGIIRIKKNIWAIILFLAICGISLFYITKSRSGDNSFRYTYYYFAMEPLMFEKWSSIVEKSNLMAYGMASGNGILFPFFYLVVNFIPVFNYPTLWRNVYDMIEGVGTSWQTITGVGTTANSYVSIFWTFYFDGRMLGIVLGMFFYGIFVAYFYKKVINNFSERNLCIYCMVMISVFYTFQQLLFQNIYWTIALIIICAFAYKKEKNDK